MLGTKRCDRCWELETRIKRDPYLAVLILRRDHMGFERNEVVSEEERRAIKYLFVLKNKRPRATMGCINVFLEMTYNYPDWGDEEMLVRFDIFEQGYNAPK